MSLSSIGHTTPFGSKCKHETWNDPERARINKAIGDLPPDVHGYVQVLADVNMEMDFRKLVLSPHSADKLIENARDVAIRKKPISQAHIVECSTFMRGLFDSRNDYGSCVAGMTLHFFAAINRRQLEMGHIDPFSET